MESRSDFDQRASRPLTRYVPRSGRRMPLRSLSVVLLPEPLGPMIPIDSPFFSLKRDVLHGPEFLLLQRDLLGGLLLAERPAASWPSPG